MLYREEITRAVKEHFGRDSRRIKHTLKVTEYAEKLIEVTAKEDIDQEIIIYSALLHDVGIKPAEEKHGSAAGKYQEIEGGPPVAKKILSRTGLKKTIIEEICILIGNHHSPGEIDTSNFKLLYDADWLVNLPAEYNLENETPKKIKQIIEKLYLTKSGKELARKNFLK